MSQHKSIVLNEIISSNGGIIKTEALAKKGFTSRDINHLVKEGTLERIKQGYYIGKERTVSDIELIATLIPTGVLCLFSAIEYYELATVNPTEICVALPRGATCPTLPPNLFVKIHHMTARHFIAGINEVEVNGAIVRIYDIEKTVCDCFKYDKEVETSIALEVLKNYMAKGNCNIQRLLEYAKLLGKRKVIFPYVEALV